MSYPGIGCLGLCPDSESLFCIRPKDLMCAACAMPIQSRISNLGRARDLLIRSVEGLLLNAYYSYTFQFPILLLDERGLSVKSVSLCNVLAFWFLTISSFGLKAYKKIQIKWEIMWAFKFQ